jgi:hypothetical protein
MYYPLSQIKTNIYTNGGELSYKSNGQEYVGLYWKTSDNKKFTGKTPQDTPTSELVDILTYNDNVSSPITNNFISINQEDIKVGDYNFVKKITNINSNISVPPQNITLPTTQDYQVGEFRRYFCKKTNELIYIEIDKSTYDKLVSKNPQIIWQLYTPINLAWQISGNKEKVATTNKNIVLLAMQRQNLSRFDEYLKFDYTKYFQ